MGKPSPEEVLARWREGARYRQENNATLQLVYRYLFPHRVSAFNQSVDAAQKASTTSFAKTRVREFASRIISGTTPLFQQWIRYQVPKTTMGAQDRARAQAEVNSLNDKLWFALGRSRWTTNFGQLIQDDGIGIGCMLIEQGPNKSKPFNIEVEAMANMAVEVDPWGQASAFFRERRRTGRQIRMRWPQAKNLPAAVLDEANEGERYETIEAVVRDTSQTREEVWYRIDILRHHQGGAEYTEVLNPDAKAMKGEGSCPWVLFRWDTAPETPWGFGPIMDILPEVLAAERLRRNGISHAELASLGVWQVDDDNTVNARNLKLRPGMIVPVQPNSRGLQPLPLPGQVDVEFLNQREFKENVDRALYLDRLGQVQGTPMSATEVIERQAELGRVVGLPYGRLIEGMEAIVTRMHRIMRDSGETKSLPSELQPEFLGPFARSQRLEEALAIREGILMIGQTVGDPQMMPAVVDIFKAATRIAELLNFPADLVRTQQGASNAVGELAPILEAVRGGAGSSAAPTVPGSAPGQR